LNCASETPACAVAVMSPWRWTSSVFSFACADDQIDRCGRPAPSQFRSATAEHGDLFVARRGLKRRCQLVGVGWLGDLSRHNAIDSVARAPGPN
jgi:hypothetical protein